MGIRFAAARAVSAVSTWGLRSAFGRPAGNLPGKLALYIDPSLLARLASKAKSGSLLVVGTNGKTTVTNLVADILETSGKQVICNRSGANLDSGIATALLHAQDSDWGVFETDELWVAKVLPFLKSDYVLLLDLFHDQMDRITEIDLIQRSLLGALAASPKTVLIYNADDPACRYIAEKTKNPTLGFGVAGPIASACAAATEATLCQCCDSLLEYDFRQYGPLGQYHCPRCSFARPELDFAAEDVQLDAEGLAFTLKMPAVKSDFARLNIEAPCNVVYMVYNLSAVAAVTSALGCPQEAIKQVIASFAPENGRLERYTLQGRRVLLNLAKNPVGFNQNVSVIAQDNGSKVAAFFVNDREGDGRDVSWLWNVDFETLLKGCGEAPTVFAGGMRANDVQVRLKYAGISAQIVKDAEDLLDCLEELPAEMSAYIIGNYTALPALKAALDKAEAAEAAEAQTLEEDGATTASAQESKRKSAQRNAEPRDSSESEAIGADGLGLKDSSAADDAGETGQATAEPVRIVELFGDLLSLFGDNGNTIVLEKRLAWRGIPVKVERVPFSLASTLPEADLLLLGGSPDREQSFAAQGLFALKDQLKTYIEQGGPLLAIDGSYQLLGERWLDDGEEKDGMGILPMHSCSYSDLGEKAPAITSVALESDLADLPVVGFENHAARTVLGEGLRSFGKVDSPHGCGNNEFSKQDGVVYKNCLGTYLHGPLLSKNPQIADYLLTLALEHHAERTGEKAFVLQALDDRQEIAANKEALKAL